MIDFLGAEAGTRTPTPLRALDPESSASANSATSARNVFEELRRSVSPHRARLCGNCAGHRPTSRAAAKDTTTRAWSSARAASVFAIASRRSVSSTMR